jgi:transposase
MKRDRSPTRVDAEQRPPGKATSARAQTTRLAARNVVLEAENAGLRASDELLRARVVELGARNDQLTARVAELEAQNACLQASQAEARAAAADLQARLDTEAAKAVTLAHLLFGRSSEKARMGPAGSGCGLDPDEDADADPEPDGEDCDAGQGSDPHEDCEPDAGADPAAPADEQIGPGEPDGQFPAEPKPCRGQRRGSRGHGRRDYSHLPARHETHEVAESKRLCPTCLAPYARLGEEVSQQLDWLVTLVVVIHHRLTYRRTCQCPQAKKVLTAPVPPKPIRKGLFTSQFLARVLVDKYVHGLPLNRIGAMLAHDGLDIAQGTLVGALTRVCDLLAPLEAAIRARNAAAGHLHVDETSWWVFAQVDGKKTHRWWLWVFVAEDTIVYRVEQSRSYAALKAHLGIDGSLTQLPEGRQLLLSSDFYAVYQSFSTVGGVHALWCWAHIRRRFVRAGAAHPDLREWADKWLGLIGALYAAHDAFLAATDDDQRRDAQARLAAAVSVIDDTRKEDAADASLNPAAHKVLATMNREWDGLTRHLQFPQIGLDNNAAERALRGPVVGRKNYYGSWSEASATLAARAWTITATLRQAGINPLTYLAAYLDACARNGGKPPEGEALEGFLFWSASPQDLAQWRAAPNGPAP